MREIKFKGYCVDLKKWVFGDLINHEMKTYILEDGFIETHDLFPVDPLSVGQLIGLEDKDGNDIYEKDILNFPIHKEGALALVRYDGKEKVGFYAQILGCGKKYFLDERSRKSYCVIGSGYNTKIYKLDDLKN